MLLGTAFWILTLLKTAALIIGLVSMGTVLLWVERRQSAMIQDRMGPNRANIRIFGTDIRLAGLVHSVADGIKMLWKEDFTPTNADKVLYNLAPFISLIPPLSLFVVIPFGPPVYWENRGRFYGLTTDVINSTPAYAHLREHVVGWNASALGVPLQVNINDSGILVIFALASAGVLGAALAGFSSDNKYSLMGGLRAAAQMVSYEVTMGISLVGAFMVYQTVRLEQMVDWQIHHMWGVFVQPLAFIVFFTAATAESKRIPFDAPEGESEIVAGYFTEYQPMKMGMFAVGELIEVMTSSALLVTLFLGGYQFPFVNESGFHFNYVGIELNWLWPHLAVVIVGALTFIIKVSVLIFIQMTIRWTLPRFRYDQIMKLGWTVLLPLSLANILVTGVALLFLNH
ncbi:MAG: complex I subunit 1 family protein [Deltaproteobacteria bacterium]